MKMSNDYIRGLVDGEGCFTFETTKQVLADGQIIKRKIPSFRIQMHERDEMLLWTMKQNLGLNEKIHKFGPYRGDGIKRGKQVVLAVRGFKQLRNIIVPLFYNRLIGHKRLQFREWLEKIGKDPEVSGYFKAIYYLHRDGYYEKEIRRGGLFEEFVD